MAQLLAAVANDAEHMPSLLFSLDRVLQHRASDEGAEVWGVGYYAEDRALVIHKPGELMSDRAFYDLARGVKSHSILAVHEQQPGATAPVPQRFRHMLFGTTGDLAPLESIRARVTSALPSFIQTEFGGRSTAALAFAMLLREMHDRGLANDGLAAAPLVRDAMRRTADTIVNLAEEEGVPAPAASYALTTGRVTVVHGGGAPVHYKEQVGLEALPDGPPDPARTDFNSIVAALKRFRAVVVAAHVDDAPHWTTVPDGQTLSIDRQLAVTVG